MKGLINVIFSCHKVNYSLLMVAANTRLCMHIHTFVKLLFTEPLTRIYMNYYFEFIIAAKVIVCIHTHV